MMDKLKEVVAYIAKYYPIKHELSNARLTKMVYLSDWHQAIIYGRQITDINWFFDNYGPFVNDVIDTAKGYPELFDCRETSNMYGSRKRLVGLRNESYEPRLTVEERESIDHIIEHTQLLTWDGFINLVYSTYPVMSSERYSHLDLVEKAEEYEEINKRLS